MNTIRFKPIPAQTIINIVEAEDRLNKSIGNALLIREKCQCLD